MRCAAFARRLQRDRVQAVFLTKAAIGPGAEVLRAGGFRVEEMPSGMDVETDARRTLEVAERHDAPLIVTDVCHPRMLADGDAFNCYHALLSRERYTVCLSGAYATDVRAHIVVNPFVPPRERDRSSEAGRTLLLGPRYFIFRDEFVRAARLPRGITPDARRVLVTIGGGDNLHLTTEVARALLSIPGERLQVRVVIGPAFPPQVKRDVSALLRNFAGDYELVEQPKDLVEEMFWADVAITGDGLTKYETAVTGTPSIMLVRPDRVHDLNAVFAEAGTTLYLEVRTLSVEDLARAIQRVLRDRDLREAMSRNGRLVVDGQGLERIIQTLPGALFART